MLVPCRHDAGVVVNPLDYHGVAALTAVVTRACVHCSAVPRHAATTDCHCVSRLINNAPGDIVVLLLLLLLQLLPILLPTPSYRHSRHLHRTYQHAAHHLRTLGCSLSSLLERHQSTVSIQYISPHLM